MVKNQDDAKEIPGYPGYKVTAGAKVFGRYGEIETIYWDTAENAEKSKRGEYVDYRKRVRIGARGKQKFALVAELVCLAFHGSKPEGSALFYLDGNDENDHAENVCWRSLEDINGREIPGFKGYRVLMKGESVCIAGRYGELKMHEMGEEEKYDWRVKIKDRFVSVAELVCRAFNGLPKKDEVSIHIDGDTCNIKPSNLKWGTKKEAKTAIYQHESGFNSLSIQDRMKIWDMAAGKNGFKRHHPHDIALEFECNDDVILGIVFGDRPQMPASKGA